MRLIQLQNRAGLRRVGVVEEPNLQFLEGCASIYELAQQALAAGGGLQEFARNHISQRSGGL